MSWSHKSPSCLRIAKCGGRQARRCVYCYVSAFEILKKEACILGEHNLLARSEQLPTAADALAELSNVMGLLHRGGKHADFNVFSLMSIHTTGDA